MTTRTNEDFGDLLNDTTDLDVVQSSPMDVDDDGRLSKWMVLGNVAHAARVMRLARRCGWTVTGCRRPVGFVVDARGPVVGF